MDYRDIENRLVRNRQLLKERDHDRLVAQVTSAHNPARQSWIQQLLTWGAFFKRLRATKPPLPRSAVEQPKQSYQA